MIYVVFYANTGATDAMITNKQTNHKTTIVK